MVLRKHLFHSKLDITVYTTYFNFGEGGCLELDSILVLLALVWVMLTLSPMFSVAMAASLHSVTEILWESCLREHNSCMLCHNNSVEKKQLQKSVMSSLPAPKSSVASGRSPCRSSPFGLHTSKQQGVLLSYYQFFY